MSNNYLQLPIQHFKKKFEKFKDRVANYIFNYSEKYNVCVIFKLHS